MIPNSIEIISNRLERPVNNRKSVINRAIYYIFVFFIFLFLILLNMTICGYIHSELISNEYKIKIKDIYIREMNKNHILHDQNHDSLGRNHSLLSRIND